jgi:VCBS repeat-containing protein
MLSACRWTGWWEDTFTYTVTDGSLSDTANLVITVAGVNDGAGRR